MDLRESPEMTEFRKMVRDWVLANMPKEEVGGRNYAGIEGNRQAQGKWFKKLSEKGWLAFRWPKEYGGAGFTPIEQMLFEEELTQLGAPLPGGFGLTMVGPLLYQFGTDEQKKKHLPAIASHTTIWCQGYSEPGSGSDLASLQTRAEIKEDHYLVNGQKTWTSEADAADWIFALVRTDPKALKQKGISFLLIDMKTPGVSIKPIKQLDDNAGFFETFFDDVKVPLENIVGKENEGWTMAKALLGHERISTGSIIPPGKLVERVRNILNEYQQDGKPMMADESIRHRFAQAEMDKDCINYTRLRLLSAFLKGKAPGPESSIFKLYASEWSHRINELATEAMGPDSSAWYDSRLSEDAFTMPMFSTISRANTIYSGSSEVQRNIIAKRVLGLPD